LFLVERLNSKTRLKFFGCPNFPSCKYSYNKPRMIYNYKEIFDEDEMCCNDFQC
jgi:ssDNA-binding Zn-finger/Zn-ribbon topoisomerase 1